MRALIVSDIHSNLEAIRAVVADAEANGGFDEVWCLGDTVGYGPNPIECIDLLCSHSTVWVVGNHDQAAVGMTSTFDFNPLAAAACDWTTSQLPLEQADFLRSLPEVARRGAFTLVHGSLRDPTREYLLDSEAAVATFRLLETQFCAVGHSHIPFICRELENRCLFDPFPEGEALSLGEERWIINPGGVGQPRDGDPRPSYALYASKEGTIERHRVTYNIEATQGKMRQAGLPEPLIERLNYGK